MQSSLTSHSRFRSSISAGAALAVVATIAAGCSDDACGPAGAPDVGIVAATDMVTLTYGHFTGGLNNDCHADVPPAGIIGLTIAGTQSDGTRGPADLLTL